jgi:DHA2 family multidrug resistance protein-like MFS transporter
MTATATPVPRAGLREWLGLAVLTLACLLYVMDLTVLHLAVPTLSADLRPSSAELLWIVDIYGYMVAGFLITMGTLVDRIGRPSLIFIMFHDPGQRAVAVAVWISAFSAGSAVGPVLGGVPLESFWWGSVFLLALPVIAALLVLGPIVLPEYRDPDAGRLDLASVVLSLVAVLAVATFRSRNAVTPAGAAVSDQVTAVRCADGGLR